MIPKIQNKIKSFSTGRLFADIPNQDPNFGPWSNVAEFESWYLDTVGADYLPGTTIGIHDNSPISDTEDIDIRPVKAVLRYDGSKWNTLVEDDVVTPAQYGCYSETDDLGAAINAAIAEGRYNIFIPKGKYTMKTTVVFPAVSLSTMPMIRIFGNFDRVSNLYEKSPETITVNTPTGIAFTSAKDSDNAFGSVKVTIENLAFFFDRSGTRQTITNCYPTEKQYDFFRGRLQQSVFKHLFVQCCDSFIHGSMRHNTQVTECNVRGVVKAVFCGPIYDCKISHNSFNAANATGGGNDTKYNVARDANDKELIQPTFVFSGYRDGKNNLLNGGIVGTTFESNYVDYFHFVFLTMDGNEYAIKTVNNTFDIFRYLITTCKLNATRTSFVGWNYDNIITLEAQRGIHYSSLNDEFLRCNNYDVSNGESTDYHLNIAHKTITVKGKIMRFANSESNDYTSIDANDSSIEYPEIYSVLGCALIGAQYTIKSIFRPSIEYVLNRTSVRISGLNPDGTAHYASAKLLNGVPYIEPASSLSINRRQYTDIDGKKTYYAGWEISGGSPAMYKFTSLVTNNDIGEDNEGSVQSAPVRFLDLMDTPVEGLVNITVKGDTATFGEINAALNQLDCKFPGRTVRFHGLTYTFVPAPNGQSVDKVKSGSGGIGHWLDNNSLAEFINSGYDWEDKLKRLKLNSSNYSTGLMIGFQNNKDEDTDTVRGAVQIPNATAPSTGDSGKVGLMMPDDKVQVTKVKNAVSAIGDTTDGNALAKVSAIKTYVGSEINAAKLDPSSSITVDSTVKQGSGNPVSGGAVYSSINSVSAKVSGLETKMNNANKAFIVAPNDYTGTFIDTGDGLKATLDTYNFGTEPGEADNSDLTIPYATDGDAGVVKIGDGLNVAKDGTISVPKQTFEIPEATETTIGGIKIDKNLSSSGYASGFVIFNNHYDEPYYKVRSLTVDAFDVYPRLNNPDRPYLWGYTLNEELSIEYPVASNNTNTFSDGFGMTRARGNHGVIVNESDYELAVNVGTGLAIGSDGKLNCTVTAPPTASSTTAGVVKIGGGLSINAQGVLNATATAYGNATTTTAGVVKVGTGLSVSNGTISVNSSYLADYIDGHVQTIPYATTSEAGKVQIDGNSNLSIDSNGVLSFDREGFMRSMQQLDNYVLESPTTSGDVEFIYISEYQGLAMNFTTRNLASENNTNNIDIVIPNATTSSQGVVKIGDGINVSSDGTISVSAQTQDYAEFAVTRTVNGSTSQNPNNITDSSDEYGYSLAYALQYHTSGVPQSTGVVAYAATDLDNSNVALDWLVTVKGLKKFLKEHIRIENDTLVFDF